MKKPEIGDTVYSDTFEAHGMVIDYHPAVNSGQFPESWIISVGENGNGVKPGDNIRLWNLGQFE